MLGNLAGTRVLVTGGTGFLGHQVVAELKKRRAHPIPLSRSLGYDLRNDGEAMQAMLATKPAIVVHLAATAGGLGANAEIPGTLFRDNMLLGINVVHAAAVARAKLITMGSACSYPENCEPPFSEERFWDGYPEPLNGPYGVSKKAIHVMMKAYRQQFGLQSLYLVPANMYGPGQRSDPNVSFVIPTMIRKFVEAADSGTKTVTCWGTGKATRSFLFVDDAACAVVNACIAGEEEEVINLPGQGETSMSELAGKIAKLAGYEGEIRWDSTKPEGQVRRVLDGTRAKRLLGWEPETSLDAGLEATMARYLKKSVSLGKS